MLKRIVYSKTILFINKLILGIFYDKKHLQGYYFNTKRAGWLWAWKGLKYRLLGPNRKIPWPVNHNTIVSNAYNIEFDPNSINIFQSPGCYFQNHTAKIIIGRNVHIAPNCGIITTNHDIYNLKKHIIGKNVIISHDCWIGMNCVILPGVVLGPHTIVGAGAVVTKSFEDGYCIIAGAPAKVIKILEKRDFTRGGRYEDSTC